MKGVLPVGRVAPLSVRLSFETLERVRREAGLQGVSVNAFVVGAVGLALAARSVEEALVFGGRADPVGSSGGSGVSVGFVPSVPDGLRDEVVVRPLSSGPSVDELVESGRVSRGVPKPRKSTCPHRVSAGSFCKRCDEG